MDKATDSEERVDISCRICDKVVVRDKTRNEASVLMFRHECFRGVLEDAGIVPIDTISGV